MKKSKFIIPIFLATLLFQTVLTGLEPEITTIGNIQASSKSLISTQVAGRVDKVLVDVGSTVKKGQAIVLIDNRLYAVNLAEAQAILETAKIEMLDAEKNFLRMQKLWQKPEGEAPSIPLKRFEDAKAKYEQATAQAKKAQENYNRAQLYFEEATIKSPYDGVVTKKIVDVGETIATQPVTNVMEIQALHPLYLEFSIPQAYMTYLHLGSPLRYEIDGITLNNSKAQIDLFYPNLDEKTRSLRCRAVLDNKDFKIRPGSLAKVTLKIDASVSNP